MRKCSAILLVLVLLLLLTAAQAADRTVKVTVDGKPATMTPTAIERAGKTYVPLRSGVKAMGGTVTWNPNTKSATVVLCGKVGKVTQAEGITIDGAIFLPLRLMSTRLACGVRWDATNQTVAITKPKTGG